MRLVHRQHRDLGALEEIERFGLDQTFGRDIDETQLAVRDAVEDGAVLGRIVRRVKPAAATP